MVDLPIDGLKAAALAATPGPEHIYTHFRDSNNYKANEWFHQNCYPQYVLELIERLERAELSLANAKCLGKAAFESKQYWAERALKAEALVTEYQKIIGGECLRLKAGDILVVRFDPRYVPTDSEQYQTLREHLYSLLPSGVHGFFLLADIGLEVISDEQLEQAGLMRKAVAPPSLNDTLASFAPVVDEVERRLVSTREPACPSSLHDGESLQDGLDALVVPVRGPTVRICADRDRECGDKMAGWCDACPKHKGGAQ